MLCQLCGPRKQSVTVSGLDITVSNLPAMHRQPRRQGTCTMLRTGPITQFLSCE